MKKYFLIRLACGQEIQLNIEDEDHLTELKESLMDDHGRLTNHALDLDNYIINPSQITLMRVIESEIN